MEDLKLLIESRYPILYVETYEEERLEELLVAAATELGLPFWTWSVTQGLERKGIDQPVYDTTKPLVALRHIASLSTSGLYLLRDFHPYLTDPTVVRELREFAQTVSGRLVTLVLCSPALELPIELRKLSARYQLDLPDEQEIRMAVVETFRQLNAHHRFRYELDEAALTRFARNLRGLTMAEVRRLVTRSAFDDFALNEADIPRVLERKRAALESSSTLEFVSVDSGVAPLGGLAHLKQWLDRFRAGFSERARELGLPAPRGVLLVGVQGCGKSLAAKTIARRWEIPLARLDPSRLYDKFIGESEKNLRDALATASAAAPIVLWIDEIEKVFADTGGDADAGLGRRLFGTFLTWLQERRRWSSSPRRPTSSTGCRPSCCARAASTRSSSSTCRARPSARRSSPSTCACASRTRRSSTSRSWCAPPPASAAPRSSRRWSPRSTACWPRTPTPSPPNASSTRSATPPPSPGRAANNSKPSAKTPTSAS